MSQEKIEEYLCLFYCLTALSPSLYHLVYLVNNLRQTKITSQFFLPLPSSLSLPLSCFLSNRASSMCCFCFSLIPSFFRFIFLSFISIFLNSGNNRPVVHVFALSRAGFAVRYTENDPDSVRDRMGSP